MKDNKTNESKGYAFFEYKDPASTEPCISATNGIQFSKYQIKLTLILLIINKNLKKDIFYWQIKIIYIYNSIIFWLLILLLTGGR